GVRGSEERNRRNDCAIGRRCRAARDTNSTARTRQPNERGSMTRERVRMIARILFVAVFAGLAVAAAYGAEEGGSASAEHGNELFKWINFAIVAGALIWLFGKVLPPIFRKRAETISSAITKATNTKAEADKLLREAEEKLAKLEQEIAQLRSVAQQEAIAEAE